MHAMLLMVAASGLMIVGPSLTQLAENGAPERLDSLWSSNERVTSKGDGCALREEAGCSWPRTSSSSLGDKKTNDELLPFPSESEFAKQIQLLSVPMASATLRELKMTNGFVHPTRQSERPECQATKGPGKDPHFLEKARPCGELASLCTDIPLVEANRDYPGGGVGAVVPGQDYLVQFDIGLHEAVARDILGRAFREIGTCLSCPRFEELCLEIVVTGDANWGNLGNLSLGLKPNAYDCMGGCGHGCQVPGRLREDIGALDCLKHDVCSAWKSVRSGRATNGYCHDPDCGDEAAMAIFNCWRGWRLFGSVGSNSAGPFSIPAVCDPDDRSVKGCWNHGGWFTKGRCKVFQGWNKGQGIPDPHPLRSPIQRL